MHGAGPPLLLASCWLSHLEFDWESPVWHHFLTYLGRIATVIRYDNRGFGTWRISVSTPALPNSPRSPTPPASTSAIADARLMTLDSDNHITLADEAV
ncbi:hypothetical protein GCM10027169_28230 [Gordonia jinhuaensis]|uniref:Uncharacterized protein n=1 Tax=Gordonia jinhuaensis TaxID=1517702 RepID=A0A916T9T0_9ACTN|nr:hypothetical protein GCM10011489_25190 [Gordonia jinhuaensis]